MAFGRAGKAAGTINKRLNCLSAIGFDVTGKRARRVRRLKWWLAPDVEAALVGELMRGGDDLMADYITWTTRTGLRVQETLTLRRSSFSTDASGAVVVTVPGLKTSMAQATRGTKLAMLTGAVSKYRNVALRKVKADPEVRKALAEKSNTVRDHYKALAPASKPASRQNVGQELEAIGKKMGVDLSGLGKGQ